MRSLVLTAAALVLTATALAVPSPARAELVRPEPHVPPVSEPAVPTIGRSVATYRALGPTTAGLAPAAPVCDDGTSGKRIQVLYVRGSSQPDTYDVNVDLFREAMVFNDGLLAASVPEKEMHLRLVHSGSAQGCVIDVRRVVVPQTSALTLGGIIDELQVRPEFQNPNRKYLFFAEVDSLFECGLAASYDDDSPGAGNLNNVGIATHAGVGKACWNVEYDMSDPNAIAPIHETFHMLGAVSARAPHASIAGHCTDESDLMCYDDDGPGSQVVLTYDNGCGGPPLPSAEFNNNTENYRLDCNRDDYFHPLRPTTGFLRANWNTANSDFLYGNEGDRFVPLPTPRRAYDSRTDVIDADLDRVPDYAGPIGPFEIAIPLSQSPASAGTRAATVPWNATAVVLNVTAIDPTVPLNVTAWPTGLAKPLASSLNVVPGTRVANQVVVKVGTGFDYGSGTISLATNRGFVHVAVDVVGYFARVRSAGGSSLVPVTPYRALDSRSGIGPYRAPWGAGEVRSVPIARGAGPVPTTATAVVLNVTATNGTAPRSHLRIFPSGNALPESSSLNFRAGDNVANQVTVGLRNGRIDIYQHTGTADVVVDVVGYYALDGSLYVPITNQRILDTRPESRIGPLTTFTTGAQAQTLKVVGRAAVPAGATGVVLNVTGVGATNRTNLRLYPTGSAPTITSNLNLVPGVARPNAVTVALSADGRVTIENFRGSVDVVIDIVGYTFAPT